jgi:hypothetical protein
MTKLANAGALWLGFSHECVSTTITCVGQSSRGVLQGLAGGTGASTTLETVVQATAFVWQLDTLLSPSSFAVLTSLLICHTLLLVQQPIN